MPEANNPINLRDGFMASGCQDEFGNLVGQATGEREGTGPPRHSEKGRICG